VDVGLRRLSIHRSLSLSQSSLFDYLSDGEKAGTICSDAVANSGLYRAQSFFIAYNNPTANEGDRFQISYTVVVDNYTPAPVPVTTPSPVGGDAGIYD